METATANFSLNRINELTYIQFACKEALNDLFPGLSGANLLKVFYSISGSPEIEKSAFQLEEFEGLS